MNQKYTMLEILQGRWKFLKNSKQNLKNVFELEKCFRLHSGRKSEITGSGLKISEKQSIPYKDKNVYLFNLQFIINNYNNSPFIISPTPLLVSSSPHPLFLQMDIQTKSKKIALLFFNREWNYGSFARILQNSQTAFWGGGGALKKNKCGGLKTCGIQEMGRKEMGNWGGGE